MSYIGKTTDGFGVRDRFVYVVSAGATSVSGADANGATLKFTDGAYVDVYLNGVLLKAGTDYNTNTANTIASLSAMSANDEVTVIVYDVFTVGDMVSATSGGTFVGNVNFSGNIDVDGTANLDVVDIDGNVDIAGTSTLNDDVTFTGANYNVTWDKSDNALEFGDNAKANFGAGNDLQIYHDGSHSYVSDQGTGGLYLLGSVLRFGNQDNDEHYGGADDDGSVYFKYDNSTKFQTTANGIGVEAGATYSHDTNFKGMDVGDQAFYGEYDGGSLYILKNRYYDGSNWKAKENGGGSTINMDTSGAIHLQTSANVNAGQTAVLQTRLTLDANGQFTHTANMNTLAGYIINTNATPYGIYLQFTGASPNNTDNYFLSGLDTSATRIKLFSSGTVKNSTGTYTSFSDERLKSDIVDAKSQWEDIKALNFKNFIKFDNPDFKQLGLIAQDVEKTSPNLVFETPPEPEEIKHSSVFGTLYEDGDELPENKKVGDVKEVKSQVKNVKDSILYMKAVKALQEAMTRIETLEAKVKALEEA